MNNFLCGAFVITICFFLTAGQDSTSNTTIKSLPSIDIGSIPNPRFFFGFGDPCTNFIYQLLGITDAKCSLQCYLQAGLQNGGYCENNVCTCNQEQTDAP